MEKVSYSQRISNAIGVKVWKHCFSCKYKKCAGEESKRICKLNNIKVSPYYVCPMWQMSNGLAKCGSGKKGRVKKPAYHKFILNEIGEKVYRNTTQFNRDIARLTNMFKQMYGSIYLDGQP